MITESNNPQPPPAVPDKAFEAEIAAYLHQHPDFFQRHERLIPHLVLHHDTRGAVSLVERQVDILRERAIHSRHELSALVQRAEHNDQLVARTQSLVLALIDAQSGAQLVEALQHSLIEELGNTAVNLLIAAPEDAFRSVAGMNTLSAAGRSPQLQAVLDNQRSCFGLFRSAELETLFAAQAPLVGSAAVVPVVHGPVRALLAVGHADQHHYDAGIGTLFIDQIVAVLGRMLARFAAEPTT